MDPFNGGGSGPELTFLYNDAYVPIFGAKHPRGLARPFREIWSEIWNDVGPLAQKALQGKSVFLEDLPLLMRRQGFDERTYFTFSYSPARDDEGQVAGVFCACTETTGDVMARDALRQEKDHLTELFRQAPGFMCVVRGPEHVFEVTNDAYLQVVGYRDLIGKRVRQALPDLDGQGFFELLDRVYETGERGGSVYLNRLIGLVSGLPAGFRPLREAVD
jgi:PAS domain-containing protein